ncbi:uncharacterized protein LOC115756433 [Rhodamnia argentea]|uniref:Uncharacterized protein LOC115756433 n=1 Tax=Rhodamnia argentea TaxID=178133 RepID=A0ABM3HHV8_9MYRT|nr:uncharacterized protein LOC115756433 [Rhodamnia argentea]
MGKSSPLYAKFLLRALAALSLVWLLVFAAAEAAGSRGAAPNPPLKDWSEGKATNSEVMDGEKKLAFRPQSDFNYMSKRRVPNGPDPIHNRRAGNSKQPPGQA